MKKIVCMLIAVLLAVSLSACGAGGELSESDSPSAENDRQTGIVTDQDIPSNSKPADTTSKNSENTEEFATMKMNVQIGDLTFTATLEDNAAVREFVEMMREAPVAIDMSDYGGFEKVGSLGRSLTSDNHQTTTAAGDIVLYSGNQIVMFYGSNSWSYTRIGKIDDLTGWEDALGSGDVTAVFSIAE